MYGKAKKPLDTTPYPRSPLSQDLTQGIAPGRYAYAVDTCEIIHVIPDGLHVHPLILGQGSSALYAGDLVISEMGVVDEITNLSGTFRFRNQRSLCCVVQHLHSLGFTVNRVIWYCPTGSRIRQLSC